MSEEAELLFQSSTDEFADNYARSVERRSDEALISASAERVRNMNLADGSAINPDPTSDVGAMAVSAARGVRDVGRDVVKGITESPRQVAGGVRDAVEDLVRDAGSASEWMREKGAMPFIKPLLPAPLQSLEYANDMLKEKDVEQNIYDVFAEMIPSVNKPKSATGAMVRSFARFMAPFLVFRVPAGQVAAKVGLTGIKAEIASSAGAGAITDMMLTSEGNLSSLIQTTKAKNVINEWMAIDGDDTEATKRLKTAFEGMGIGLLFEGTLRGLRSVRNWRQAKAAERGIEPKNYIDQLRNEVGEITEKDLDELMSSKVNPIDSADTADLAVERLAKAEERVGTRTPEEISARAESGKDIYFNFNRVNSEDDVKDLLKRVMRSESDELNKARRLGRTHRIVEEEAKRGSLTIKEILSRKEGSRPWSDVESKQARDLMESATERLLELERSVLAGGGTAEQFAYRKMLIVHQSLLEQLLGARADASRALSAWGIDAKSSVARALQVRAAVEAAGGDSVTIGLAKKLSNSKNWKIRQKRMNNGWRASTMAAVREVGVLGLLWSPKTHLVNVMSTAMAGTAEIGERAVAGVISKAMGRAAGEGVELAEAPQMMYATIMSMRDAFRAASHRARTGESIFGELSGSKIEIHEGAFKATSWGMASDTGIGKALDIFGSLHQSPGRALAAEDEFFRFIGYRREIYALAARESRREGAINGWSRSKIKERAADIINNPPESIKLASIDAANYATFTRRAKGSIAKIAKDVSKLPLGYNVFPFVNTPAELFSYSMERMPPPFALLSKSWRQDIAAGGARRDVALARTAAGSTIMLLALDYADDGTITGSGPTQRGEMETLRRTGWLPNSIVMGNGDHVSWNRFDQYAPLLSFAAEMDAVQKLYDLDEEDMNTAREMIVAGSMVVVKSITDRTYTIGLADLVEAMSNPERGMEWYLQQRVRQNIPFSSALRSAETIVDPRISDVNGLLWEPLMSLIPGFASSLPKRKDLWGRDVQPDPSTSRWYHGISPVAKSGKRGEPIDVAMAEMGIGFERMRKRMMFTKDGVTVPVNFHEFPRSYERLQELAGTDAKDLLGRSALERLNGMVTGNGADAIAYDFAESDEDKRALMQNIIRNHRKLAKIELLKEPDHAAFADYVNRLVGKSGSNILPSR